MKHSVIEYQQGDWAYPYKCSAPDRVYSTTYQEEPCGIWRVITFKHRYGVFNYPAMCSPVSLTSEILEKNGFVHHHKDDAWYATVDKKMAGDGFEVQQITVYPRNIVEVSSSVCFLKMQCNYVHELQHAIRLCGIDKDIVL